MRKDKIEALKLRREGKSYRAIHNTLGVSKSTLSAWFKDESWSKETKSRNQKRNIIESTNRLSKLHNARMVKLRALYETVEKESVLLYTEYRNEPLFMAGLFAYAGEGDKSSSGNTRISNSEPYIIEVFIRFAEKYLDISRSDIKLGLLLYPDNNEAICKKYWSARLGIREEQFYKSQILSGGASPKKRLQYGVGLCIISSTVVVKKRMITWLRQCESDFTK